MGGVARALLGVHGFLAFRAPYRAPYRAPFACCSVFGGSARGRGRVSNTGIWPGLSLYAFHCLWHSSSSVDHLPGSTSKIYRTP